MFAIVVAPGTALERCFPLHFAYADQNSLNYMMEETSIVDQATMALAFKEEGNNAFKKQNFVEAKDFYSKAIMQLGQIPEDDQMSLLLCNRAAAQMKLLDYSACISDCDRAIKINPAAVKAYYRRAQAQLAVGALSAASTDTQMLLRLDPSNADAISLMRIIKAGELRRVHTKSYDIDIHFLL